MKQVKVKTISNVITLLMVLSSNFITAQGYNHNWLLCYHYNSNDTLSRMTFDSNSYNLIPEQRKIPFKAFTQANISDENGNLLMSTNGVWIANSTGDTMKNGKGLNPNSFTSAWIDGLPIPYGSLFLPYPDDSTKYVLFHQTGDSLNNVPSTELYFSIIDIAKDSVISKNNILFHDTISWGLAACRHANGRDWWIVAQKDSSNFLYRILLTPTGITNLGYIQLNFPISFKNASQMTFSPDGTKFSYTTNIPYHPDSSFVLLCNFDRCNGTFINETTFFINEGFLFGLAFSSNSKIIYTNSAEHIFQIDLDNSIIDTITTYDGFNSPYAWCCPTTFFNCYLAANGKIYLTSGNGVRHIHEINFPDSIGTVCDIQQHAVPIPTQGFHRGSVPNHPNYYLGCDTTSGCPCLVPTTGINEIEYDFKFKIFPNPVTNNILNISYLLPQNKQGLFEIYDVTGKVIFKYILPQWSNVQSFKLPKLANGIYNCLLTSDNKRVSKKIAVINQ